MCFIPKKGSTIAAVPHFTHLAEAGGDVLPCRASPAERLEQPGILGRGAVHAPAVGGISTEGSGRYDRAVAGPASFMRTSVSSRKISPVPAAAMRKLGVYAGYPVWILSRMLFVSQPAPPFRLSSSGECSPRIGYSSPPSCCHPARLEQSIQQLPDPRVPDFPPAQRAAFHATVRRPALQRAFEALRLVMLAGQYKRLQLPVQSPTLPTLQPSDPVPYLLDSFRPDMPLDAVAYLQRPTAQGAAVVCRSLPGKSPP